jgi:hypothetical protein
VERLWEYFVKRGVTVGAGGLMALVSANAVQAAPAGLAITISAAATLAGSTLATTATAAAVKTIAMTALQKAMIATTVAILVAVGFIEARRTARSREEIQVLRQQQAQQIQQLQSERE